MPPNNVSGSPLLDFLLSGQWPGGSLPSGDYGVGSFAGGPLKPLGITDWLPVHQPDTGNVLLERHPDSGVVRESIYNYPSRLGGASSEQARQASLLATLQHLMSGLHPSTTSSEGGKQTLLDAIHEFGRARADDALARKTRTYLGSEPPSKLRLSGWFESDAGHRVRALMDDILRRHGLRPTGHNP